MSLACLKSPMSKQFNVTTMLLFVQSLPQMFQSLPVVNKTLPQMIQTLPQMIQTLPQMIQTLLPAIPFEAKISIFLALIIVSYISHRSYLQSKVSLLENTVAELYKGVATLESEREKMMEMISDMEIIMENCDKKAEFMFSNISYLQKALYKKLDFEERYRDGKKEANLAKNRQQAIQEYLNAELIVARRFTEV